MRLRLVLIIPAIAVLIPILVFTILYENSFMSIDHKQQLIQLALSDSRVKQALDDRPYHVYFGPDSLIPNIGPPFTDTIIRFVFDNGSYVLVRENFYLHKVIDVSLGTTWKIT